MSAELIGFAKSKKENSYEGKYNRATERVYVLYSQWIETGKAPTAAEAMIKAQENRSDKQIF